MTNQQRLEVIREKLSDAFAPQQLDIVDESHKHAGHVSAAGGGHFAVTIISPLFEGKNPVQRHQMVFGVLAEEMQANEIHALSIRALTPSEASS